MKNDKQMLMKHFSAVLRKRANAESDKVREVTPSLAKYLTRKEIVEIVLNVPKAKDTNLLELENEELLTVMGDDLFIISYFVNKWCQEISEPVSGEKPKQPSYDKDSDEPETKSGPKRKSKPQGHAK